MITEIEPQELQPMYKGFGNKPLLRFQGHGFEQFLLSKAYKNEEDNFLDTVEIIPRDDVPSFANIIKIYTIYKVSDDGSMKLKARIYRHGNGDSMKDELTTDCASCSPSGLRIL